MLKRLTLTNLTAFAGADITFARNLNVIVGENATGKTHILKIIYSVIAVSAEEARRPQASLPTKSVLQTRFAEKIINVFHPDTLGRLTRRRQGRERCSVELRFCKNSLDTAFDFATNSKSEVNITVLPTAWQEISPAYMPTRELLTIFPNFVSVYDRHYLEFDETWRDTCLLLGAPPRRGPKEKRIGDLLKPLERSMGGTVELDPLGRFYLRGQSGRIEAPLVAEGVRKLAMLARLVSSGILLENGYLFWDEPEANLNPRLVKEVARSIVAISRAGVQVFIATHSLFLLREIEILMSEASGSDIEARFIGLSLGDDGVDVRQGSRIEDVGDIAALDEELEQSDRFLAIGD